jgi:ABC-type transporter Mla subunit MlaD
MSDLKNKYNQLFGGNPKSNDKDILSEGTYLFGATSNKKNIKEVNEKGHLTAKDFGTFNDSINKVYDLIADLDDEIGSTAEQASEATNANVYAEIITQTSRHLVAAQKELEALKKYLHRTTSRIF